MAGGKETPRQKMIGMMYLVLTALLALNVSKDIVIAFITLNDKLDQSTEAIVYKNGVAYQDFENFHNVPQTKALVAEWRPKALQIQQLSNRVHDFYLSETNRLIKAVEGDAKEWIIEENGKKKLANLMDIGSKDDYDAATRLFVGDPGNINDDGKKLMTEMHNFRDSLCYIISTYSLGKNNFTFGAKFDGGTMSNDELMTALSTANPKDTAKLKQIYSMLSLPAEMENHGEKVAWQAGMFDHAPVVAASALFTSLRNDVRNAESVALDHLLTKVNAPKFNFNKIEPLAFARTSYLNVGDSMNLSVMIAAYDSNEVPKIRYAINDSNPANFKDHIGKLPIQGGSPGAYTLHGLISVKENGEDKWKPWKYMYEVGEPTGVIANEDLTVIYAGYEHTFSASVSGYPQDRVSLSLPGVTASPKGGGKFSVKAPANMMNKKVQSSVTVRTDGGGTKSFSGPIFTVKPLPTPTTYLGSLSAAQNAVSIGELKTNAQFIRVAYDASVTLDPNKVKFSVLSYEMNATVGAATKAFPGKGGQLTPEMQNFIKVAKPGTVITFSSIVASGPAGQVRVPALVFKVK